MHILHSRHHATAAYTVLERVSGAELQGAGLSSNGKLRPLFRVTTAILGDRTIIRFDDFQNRFSSVRDFVTGRCQFSTGDRPAFEKNRLSMFFSNFSISSFWTLWLEMHVLWWSLGEWGDSAAGRAAR